MVYTTAMTPTSSAMRFGLFEKRKAKTVIPGITQYKQPVTHGDLLRMVAKNPKGTFDQIAIQEFGLLHMSPAGWGYAQGEKTDEYTPNGGSFALETALKRLMQWSLVDSLEPKKRFLDQNLRITDKGKKLLDQLA